MTGFLVVAYAVVIVVWVVFVFRRHPQQRSAIVVDEGKTWRIDFEDSKEGRRTARSEVRDMVADPDLDFDQFDAACMEAQIR